jgi:hypothetical protein
MRAKALSNTRRKTVELQTVTTDMAAATAADAAADAATLLFYFFTTIDKRRASRSQIRPPHHDRGERKELRASSLLPVFPSFSELINGFSMFFLLLLYRGGGFSSFSSFLFRLMLHGGAKGGAPCRSLSHHLLTLIPFVRYFSMPLPLHSRSRKKIKRSVLPRRYYSSKKT